MSSVFIWHHVPVSFTLIYRALRNKLRRFTYIPRFPTNTPCPTVPFHFWQIKQTFLYLFTLLSIYLCVSYNSIPKNDTMSTSSSYFFKQQPRWYDSHRKTSSRPIKNDPPRLHAYAHKLGKQLNYVLKLTKKKEQVPRLQFFYHLLVLLVLVHYKTYKQCPNWTAGFVTTSKQKQPQFCAALPFFSSFVYQSWCWDVTQLCRRFMSKSATITIRYNTNDNVFSFEADTPTSW